VRLAREVAATLVAGGQLWGAVAAAWKASTETLADGEDFNRMVDFARQGANQGAHPVTRP